MLALAVVFFCNCNHTIEHERKNTSATNRTKKNWQSCRSVEILFAAHRKRKSSSRTPAHAQQNSAFPERQLLFTVWSPKKAGSKPVRSQARPRGSESAQLRKENQSSWNNWERYNDTRRWRCYETALLLKKKRDKGLTRKHPWPHPSTRLFSGTIVFPWESSALFALERTAGNRKSFFRKREKANAFSFSIKEIYLSLSLVSILQ